jgi:hypothetical protein
MRKHSYLSPSLRQWLIVSSVQRDGNSLSPLQRDGNSLSPLIPFLCAVLPRGESKECVLPLLQQRSVCCRCCSKGVCVAAVAAKECVLPLFPQYHNNELRVQKSIFSADGIYYGSTEYNSVYRLSALGL